MGILQSEPSATPRASAVPTRRAQRRGEEPTSEGAPVRALRVAFAGGGTGGHILPGRHLLAAGAGRLGDVLWFCTGRPVEENAFGGIDLDSPGTPVERVALQLEPDGGGAPSSLGLALRTLPATRAAHVALRRHGSEVVVGLGGFTCLPVVLAARWLGLPVALLEINAAPGKATRWLARGAARVFHAWRDTLPGGLESEHDLWTGPPLAPAFTRGSARPAEVESARASLGFDVTRPVLVVLGGSQGAGALNDFVARHLEPLTRDGLQILHQTGPGRLAEGAVEREGYRKVEYVSDVHLALSAASTVLCRGGASTLAEVAALRRPAWVVPYPHHTDHHQALNARALGAGATIVDQARLGLDLAREIAAAAVPSAAAALDLRARELELSLPLDAAQRIWQALSDLVRARRTRRPPPSRPQAS